MNFRNHIKMEETIEFENTDGTKDVCVIKALDYDFLDRIFYLAKFSEKISRLSKSVEEDLKGKTKGEIEEETGLRVLSSFDKQTIDSIKEVILATLEKSYPDEDKETLSVFGMQNMMVLLMPIVQLNMAVANAKGKNK